ncbi:drug/metabolite transporter (DMT)-like permease [Comamonas sp. BIGb0152]|uniref:DMT family transporter n=1 Tax=Comamonas sp. BIGb0152 TaxID=2940601 RepID=UPI00216A7C49|nr:DMT family transporter [Comamonas sp. BIGb0152]MCS4294272.1 drug/metabolite transporter (DMT)-like permease [Comamonas sp. BIGb0152]
MLTALPFLALMTNALIWGTIWWPFRQLQAMGVHPVLGTALVYLILFCGLLLVKPTAAAIARRHPMLLLLAFTSGSTNVLFNWAATTGDVVRVVLLFYLMPAWSVLLAWYFLGERPNKYSILRLVLAFSGVLIVMIPAGATWQSLTANLSLPDALAIVGGFTFAGTNVVLRSQYRVPGEARMLAMFFGGLVAAGAMSVLGIYLGRMPAIPAIAWSWPLMVLVVALLIMVSNWTLQYGASRLAATTAAVVMLSEVVFASASNVMIEGAVLSGRLLLGGALVLSASLIAAIESRLP